MLVTDKKYSMEKGYAHKLDLMIKRMKGTDDNILVIDGDEGQGKTEFAFGTCYYVAQETGREYGIDNIFFDIDEGIAYAGRTEDKIIHFDEGAFGLLRTQWQKKLQQKFLQFVMTARKKRHFIVICIPKFHRLGQYIMEERSIALIHIYSRNNLEKGRFLYYTKKSKERLWGDWERKKVKNYKKYWKVRGTFPKVHHKIFTDEQMKAYEDKKDFAIRSITEVGGTTNKKEEVPKEIKFKVIKKLFLKAKESFPKQRNLDWSVIFGTDERTLRRWNQINKLEKTPKIALQGGTR